MTRRGRSDPVPNCSNDAWKDWSENSTVCLGFIKLPILGRNQAIQIGIWGMWKFHCWFSVCFVGVFLGIRYHGIYHHEKLPFGSMFYFFTNDLQANLSSLMPSWKNTLNKRDEKTGGFWNTNKCSKSLTCLICDSSISGILLPISISKSLRFFICWICEHFEWVSSKKYLQKSGVKKVTIFFSNMFSRKHPSPSSGRFPPDFFRGKRGRSGRLGTWRSLSWKSKRLLYPPMPPPPRN